MVKLLEKLNKASYNTEADSGKNLQKRKHMMRGARKHEHGMP